MKETSGSREFDLIIAGAGTMGSAAAWYASKNGIRVLLLEQFPSIPHDQGSHAGQSRIIRKAYFEHPDYVPLLTAAYELWKQIEEESNEKLFIHAGLIYSGPPGHAVIEGVKYASASFDIPVNTVSSFPFFTAGDHELLLEQDAGFVLPEKTIEVLAGEAVKKGTILHTDEKLLNWKEKDDRLNVITNKGSYTTSKLIITAGAWAGKIMAAYQLPLKVTRQLIIWVDPVHPERFYPENFPCWMIAEKNLPGVYYGFPYLRSGEYPGPTGMKFAHHHALDPADPDFVNREISRAEVKELVASVGKYFPAVNAEVVAAKTCLYTSTPDEDFIIDHLPGSNGKVVVACGFSGHGFKFAPVTGKIVVDLALKGVTDLPIGFLSLGRFNKNNTITGG